jgi:methylated-DNA-[protein]-cysteine S-methyltransferase
MPTTIGHVVFKTALGFVGLAWSEAGLTRLCLPQASREAVERRLLRLIGVGLGESPPRWVEELTAGIRAYAEGEEVDFSGVPVDLAGIDAFRRAIYEAARRLTFGETTTYGELARRAGHAGLPRETGGFSAPGGASTKEKMLRLEGVRLDPPPPAQASFGF